MQGSAEQMGKGKGKASLGLVFAVEEGVKLFLGSVRLQTSGFPTSSVERATALFRVRPSASGQGRALRLLLESRQLFSRRNKCRCRADNFT